MRSLRTRWREEGGYREVLSLAVPLILSTGAWSVQHFVDRMFLTWYSPEAIAAAMPAGIVNFTLMSLFLGTAGYAGTFVAQYYGAKRYERIGPAVWQGVYVAVIGGVVLLAVIPLARPFFRAVGHAPQVQAYEVVYFRILCFGAFPAIAASAFAGFFTGLSRVWPVMWGNVLATAVNLLLDYALIFGHWGMPRLGVKGAAVATVASGVFLFSFYLLLLAQPAVRRTYHTLRGWRFDRELFGRLMHFGLPSGIQFFLDIFGFTAFLLFVGRLGTIPLAATNIAFNINTLAFMPMVGFGIAISVLVGQRLGENRPDLAERSVWSGFHLTFTYMTTVAALYVVVPEVFIRPFAANADPAAFGPIGELTRVLLRFVAVYSLFDTMNIVFASAIKGAGDTRFVMRMIVVVSLLVFVLPVYVAITYLGAGIFAVWAIASVYISVLGVAFLLRFLGGRWKQMRVIEEAPVPPVVALPDAPATE